MRSFVFLSSYHTLGAPPRGTRISLFSAGWVRSNSLSRLRMRISITAPSLTSEPVNRTANACRSTVEDMGVHRGRLSYVSYAEPRRRSRIFVVLLTLIDFSKKRVRGRHQMSRCCACDCFFLDTRVNQAMVERRRIRDGIEAI